MPCCMHPVETCACAIHALPGRCVNNCGQVEAAAAARFHNLLLVCTSFSAECDQTANLWNHRLQRTMRGRGNRFDSEWSGSMRPKGNFTA